MAVSVTVVALSVVLGLSLGKPLLGLVDVLLGNIDVSVVSPDRVWSQELSGSVDVGLPGDVLDGSSLVVVGDLKGLSVLIGLDLSDLGLKEVLVSEV